MEVKNVVKTSKGVILFEGELSQEESDVVVSLGLNYLLENGILKIDQNDEEVEH